MKRFTKFIRWGREISTMEPPRSFDEKCRLLGITSIDEGARAELSASVMDIASSHAFVNHSRGSGRSWHLHALDMCVNSGERFGTNISVVADVVRELVRVVSPYTGEVLGPEQICSGGGSGDHHSWRWRDSQGNEVSLGFASDAMGFTPGVREPAPEAEQEAADP